MPCNKVPGSSHAYGYWGRSPYKRVEQEQTSSKIRALLQDKLITRGQGVVLYTPVTSGTPCTCKKETNQVSDRICPECYGTGYAPGYVRFLHETLYFTASQVAAGGLQLLPQALSAPSWSSSTVTSRPNVSLPNVAQTVAQNPWGTTTSVLSPTTHFSGTALAPTAGSGASVSTGAVTASGGGLNNVTLDRTMKPNYLKLVDGATTGFLLTTALPYYNPNGDPWYAQSVGYARVPGNSVTAEYSFNGGLHWYPLENITSINPPPPGVGTLMFRITLTRASASDRTPYWSVIRARHANSHNYREAQLSALRGNLNPGEILVLRPWVVEQAQSDSGRGLTIDWMSDRSWTAPLDFFDKTVQADSSAARIEDRAPGPHPFYEHRHGIKTGDRIVLSSFKWNEELGSFTHQSFDERRAQPSEPPYADVF